MDASIVDKDLIERINKGEEKAFEVLYNSYFVYLCACANSYIFSFFVNSHWSESCLYHLAQ
jgi:hypothetical protein